MTSCNLAEENIHQAENWSAINTEKSGVTDEIHGTSHLVRQRKLKPVNAKCCDPIKKALPWKKW